ncbi:MAG: hypothetical protein ACRD94_02600, partial [Nitrosopumilaceae archaeon]
SVIDSVVNDIGSKVSAVTGILVGIRTTRIKIEQPKIEVTREPKPSFFIDKTNHNESRTSTDSTKITAI